MITPAISVLSAVEGLEVVEPSLEDLVVLDRGGDHHRPLRAAEPRHGPCRPAVRTCDACLVLGARGAGRPWHRRPPWHPAGTLAALRRAVLRRRRAHCVPGARWRRAGRHGRRGAVRRHGSLRARPDPRRVAPGRLPRADPQLSWAGRADPRAAGRSGEPVLPAGAALGTRADDLPGVRRDRDRVAGGDLRRLLGHPPGGAARLPAAPADPAHVASDGRPGLRAVRQLGAARRRTDPRVRVRGGHRSSRRPTGSPSPARSRSRSSSS